MRDDIYTTLRDGLAGLWQDWAELSGVEPYESDNEPDWRGHNQAYMQFVAELDQIIAELRDEDSDSS